MNSFMDEPEKVLRNGREVFLRGKGSEKGPLQITLWQIYKNSVFLEFAGVDDIAAAESLVGCHVFLPKTCLEPLPEGEYYWQDLIGMTVVTENQEVLGAITSIFPTGSNDVYVCAGEKGEMLIPAISDVILQIDPVERRMVIRLLEGMDGPC